MASRSVNPTSISNLSLADQILFSRFGLGASETPAFHCVHHAFEAHAASQPNAIAVEHLGESITYAELDRQANGVATLLRSANIGPNSRVCLLVERSILMVVGILAILKAGGAYVPLDGTIVTQSTLDHVVNDSGCTVAVVLERFAHRITTVPLVKLEEAVPKPGEVCIKPEDLSSPSDSAYIIYTSGTTGKPKGVDVMHGNVTNLVCLYPGNIGMAPGKRVSQLLNIAFDMAAWEILGSMSNGCTLCIRGKSSKEWRAVMKTVDIVIATPSMMGPHDPADYPNIKAVATAGEVCPKILADSWAKTANFFNSCGPTEITIVNTLHLHKSGETLTIGGPSPNNNVYVLDEDLKPVPIGETGVMWAGGAGISRGYLNLPEKTAERYKRDPFMDDGSVMFNTGDLGRWSGDGELEHLGRTDDQVKIKGFRVELDGVGAAMETHPEVKVAVAILIEKELWGFVTPANVNTEEVKAAATKVQPYYAVPTHYLAMDSFPHTANGKIDKRALKQLAAEKGTVSVAPPSLTVARAIPSGPFVFRPLSTASQETLVVPPKGELMPYKPSGLRSGESTAANSTIDLSSSLEKGNIWDGYKEDELPEKTQGKWIRNLRFQVFSLYRRLFSIVFISNMIALIVILSQGAEKRNAKRIGQIVVANIFSGVLMRQEYIVNGFFNFFTSVPRSWPIWIRRVCARVYAIGGLHSGFGVSGLIWLIVFTVQATREYVNKQQTSLATVIITYFILALLMTIVTFAYPTIRKKFHNKFEATHRFLGWTATGLVWAQVISLTNDYKPADQSLGQALVHSAPFWLVVVMTASIFLPWAHLKKVPVVPEVLSSHAVRLHFNYTTPRAGSFVRLSDKPLTEWHSFATISEPQKHGFSVVVSKAGDWTSKVIANPPREIWVRGIPTLGVLNILPMFRRVVLVATGSGIGPCTPAVLEQRIPIRLLWTAPSVRGTFGDKLVDSLLTANPDTVIYDTRKHGKPDMVKLTHRLVQEFNAEAVIIISNEKLTQKVVYGMMSRGIPAFGAIWDS